MDGEDTGLDIEDARGENRPGTALERIKQVSNALADAARRSRVASRRGSAYSGGGFKARSGSRFMRWLAIVSFALVVGAPSVVGAAYFFVIASDQYVSEADFVVSSASSPMPDGVASFTGMPALAIFQDTQIVTNYIHSRAALEKLDQSLHLRRLYSEPGVDFFARLNPKKPIEQFLKYWSKMSDVGIVMPAGFVQLKVRAFTPQEAHDITQATVDICESLVNELNARMNSDAVANATQELERASKRLGKALQALETARNQSGILETSKSADALLLLVRDTKSGLLAMQGQYEAQLRYVLPTAPQMRELSSRIEVTKKQLAEIEAKLTSTGSVDSSDPTLSQSMTKFGELDVERTVAEQLYAGAAASLEGARINAENKMMYFKTFVSPVVPQESTYPRRGLYSFLLFTTCLAVWGLLMGVSAMLRNYIA